MVYLMALILRYLVSDSEKKYHNIVYLYYITKDIRFRNKRRAGELTQKELGAFFIRIRHTQVTLSFPNWAWFQQILLNCWVFFCGEKLYLHFWWQKSTHYTKKWVWKRELHHVFIAIELEAKKFLFTFLLLPDCLICYKNSLVVCPFEDFD